MPPIKCLKGRLWAVTITSYQIQNVLRTYNRQLSRRESFSKAARLPVGGEAAGRSDMSAQAKRQEVIGRITKEIVSRIAHQQQGSWRKPSGEEGQALQTLSEEYGQPLQVSLEGGLETFRVVDEAGGRLVPLPELDSEKLRQRLFELTRDIIDQNMVKA
jgi:hypothetical protein